MNEKEKSNHNSADPSRTRKRRSAKNSANTADTASPLPMQTAEEFVQQKLAADAKNSPKEQREFDIDSIQKQFKRKKNKIPASETVQRYAPDIAKGLTTQQVNERFSNFLFNDTNQKYSKSYASIFISNICTFFNLLCALAAIALAFANAPISQYLFVLIFALFLTRRKHTKIAVIARATEIQNGSFSLGNLKSSVTFVVVVSPVPISTMSFDTSDGSIPTIDISTTANPHHLRPYFISISLFSRA